MECRDAPAERPRPAPGQALSRSLVTRDHNSTIIAVVELSQSSWLVGGVLPGIERQPRKKLEPSPERLLRCCIAGAMRRSKPAAILRGLRWLSKPAATASRWRAGLRRVASRRTGPLGVLFGKCRHAHHATPSCSSAGSWVGCGARDGSRYNGPVRVWRCRGNIDEPR